MTRIETQNVFTQVYGNRPCIGMSVMQMRWLTWRLLRVVNMVVFSQQVHADVTRLYREAWGQTSSLSTRRRKTNKCVFSRVPSAVNTTLRAFAAERRATAARLPATGLPYSCSPCCDGTDRRTPCHYMDPAPHTVWAEPKTRTMKAKFGDEEHLHGGV